MCIIYGEVLREVATLSRLQHQHVVRYYQVILFFSLVSSLYVLAITVSLPFLFSLFSVGFYSISNTEIMIIILVKTSRHGLKQELLILMVIACGVLALWQAPHSATELQAQLMSPGRRISLNQHIYIFKWNIALGRNNNSLLFSSQELDHILFSFFVFCKDMFPWWEINKSSSFSKIVHINCRKTIDLKNYFLCTCLFLGQVLSLHDRCYEPRCWPWALNWHVLDLCPYLQYLALENHLSIKYDIGLLHVFIWYWILVHVSFRTNLPWI